MTHLTACIWVQTQHSSSCLRVAELKKQAVPIQISGCACQSLIRLIIFYVQAQPKIHLPDAKAKALMERIQNAGTESGCQQQNH